ncbi:MAG: hypothetical protein AAF420_13180, partial [Pseudomonadota bacterium]
AEFFEFDLYSEFELAQGRAEHRAVNTIDACVDWSGSDNVITVDAYHEDCESNAMTAEFSHFLFFDDTHPTGWVHRSLSVAMTRELEVSQSP